MAYPKQYAHVSVSISDCQKIFALDRYTPEQIVDAVFSSPKTRPVSRDQFIQTFKATFERNATPDLIGKVNDGAARIYEVCSGGSQEINVDQLGKGIGAFTTKREATSPLRDLFFYLDKDFRGTLQESQIYDFVQEASSKGATRGNTTEVSDLKQVVSKDKGRFELTYWSFFVWRNHPCIGNMLFNYQDLQSKRQLSTLTIASSPSYVTKSVTSSINALPTEEGRVRELDIAATPREGEKQKNAGAFRSEQAQPAKQEAQQADIHKDAKAVPMFGDAGIMGRRTDKIHTFDDFLTKGTQLGLHDVSAKEYMLKSKAFFAQQHRSKGGNGDMTLHEFMRLCVQSFKKENQDYYQFTNTVTQLFQFMDLNGNGILELNEALQGIIHLFGGTEEDKITAVFMMLDLDDSGFIEYGEVETFILSTLKLQHNKGHGLDCEHEEELKAIAEATAKDVFHTMDISGDSRVSLEEFLAWFRTTKGAITPAEAEHAKEMKKVKLAEFQAKVEHHKHCHTKGLHTHAAADPYARVSRVLEETNAANYVIDEVRKLIPFEKVHIQLAVTALKDQFGAGVVNFNSFGKFLQELLKTHNLPGKESVQEVSRKLFNALDTNKNGLLELSEIATGLGLLCGGTQSEKMKAGFDLFDENEDKVLDLRETTNYMSSFFKVITSANPNTAIENADPDEFARELAITVFRECNIPPDGALEFHQLKEWVNAVGK